jgi:hypothetical protein
MPIAAQGPLSQCPKALPLHTDGRISGRTIAPEAFDPQSPRAVLVRTTVPFRSRKRPSHHGRPFLWNRPIRGTLHALPTQANVRLA